MDATLTQEEMQHYIRRLHVLEQERKKGWESHWRDLSQHFLPRRARFLDSGEETNRGDPRNKLQDSIGIMALRILANGMQSGLTSPARPWFSLTLEDMELAKSEDAKFWLNAVYENMVSVFSKSNFYDQIHVLYSELAAFGTAAMILEQDVQGVIRCRTLTVGEYCIDTGENGRVDSLYRRIRMTPRQVLQAWPESCPETIRQSVKSDNAEWITILHAVEPNKEVVRGSGRGNERPWRSVFIVLEGASRECLEDSGYYEFPALCPRWVVTGSDVYGACPAMDALPDCKQLQAISKDTRMALELEVRPPLLVTASTDAGLNISPGAVNFASGLSKGQDAVIPLYQAKANLTGAKDTRLELKDQIQRHFHNDLFLMISEAHKNMTATEVAERNGEKMLMLGPVLDRLRSELFQPLIERVYGIMDRAGLIPFPPESLTEQPIKVEFISILAQAQKAAGVGTVGQMVQFIGQLAALKQSPEPLDKLDVDKVIDVMADLLGSQPGIILSDDAAEEIRLQRAQQVQQAQQMEMLSKGAEIADRGSKALGNLAAGAALSGQQGSGQPALPSGVGI
ncbi:MAG: head-tail connector protein [Desulfovibrio sp.]|jgi:hypothetical protein|nr:head-tail connector protein [Desulfovibrio sp.]